MFTISEINSFSETEFKKVFENIIEHYPNVSNYLYDKLPFENVESLSSFAEHFLATLTLKDKECVLNLHPDLAGKLAETENLTEESSEEQKSAGLNTLTVDDKTRMAALNNTYRSKFGFPFIICARENKVVAIFKGMADRLNNTREQELEIGIKEVTKICKLRILNICRI